MPESAVNDPVDNEVIWKFPSTAMLEVINCVTFTIPADKRFVEILSAFNVPVLNSGAAIILLGSRIQILPVLGRAAAGIELSGKKAAMFEAIIFPRGILES